MLGAVLLMSCVVANSQTGSASAPSAPAQITTVDGRTYQNTVILRAEPDGIIVSYQPQEGGIGMAKLKFRDLPESLRSQYQYNAEQANAFEAQQAQTLAQWRAQQVADTSFQRYRALADLHRALAGEDYSSYSVSLGADGKVSAEGYTANIPPYVYYYGPGYPLSTNPMPGTGGVALPTRGY